MQWLGASRERGLVSSRLFLKTRFWKRPHDPPASSWTSEQSERRSGTHNHQCPLHAKLGPLSFLQRTSVVMGSGCRRDDVETASSAIRAKGF
jgi:hypothetical protein